MSTASNAIVMPTGTDASFKEAVVRAAELLCAGEVVAVPTETVYGLAANAWNPAAVAKIYAAKGRPSNNPIIVHVADLTMAKRCVKKWTNRAELLAKAYWPGPLTLVLEKSACIPDIVTSGGATVGLRHPNHPFMESLIRHCNFPLAAPSANLANCVSPTSAHHVKKQLGARIPLIVDGGASRIGIESTVVDLTSPKARVLRPGMIHEESLAAVLGDEFENASSRTPSEKSVLKSPGCLPRHYSPQGTLILLSWSHHDELSRFMHTRSIDPRRTWLISYSGQTGNAQFLGASILPHTPESYARAMYAELHRADDAHAQWIIVENTPSSPEWKGIADRLSRAAAPKSAH